MHPSEPEIDLVRLPPSQWKVLLSAAVELDLIRGGYYRVRGSSIQFYCGPENAPINWKSGYPEGSPDLPRALVGEAHQVEPGESGEILVRLQVSNWGAMRGLKLAFENGEYRGKFAEYVRDQESALRGRAEDREWLRVRFRRLLQYALGSLLKEE